LQVLSLKDSFKPSFACLVRVLTQALGFIAGQLARGFTPPDAGPPRFAGV
jgi:hypothetical protein